MHEIVLSSSKSDQYSSAPKEISKFPLMYMTGYFCRSVYKSGVYWGLSFQVYLQISGLHVTVNSKRIKKYTNNIYVVMAVYKISA